MLFQPEVGNRHEAKAARTKTEPLMKSRKTLFNSSPRATNPPASRRIPGPTNGLLKLTNSGHWV
jgi:hypothetical protein